MKNVDQAQKKKEALDNAKGVDDIDFIGPAEPASHTKARKDLASKRLNAAAKADMYQHMTADETHAEGLKENIEHDKADKAARELEKLSNSAAGTTGKLLIFSAGLSKAGKILSAIADKFLGETAIDEDRLAASTGTTAQVIRG